MRFHIRNNELPACFFPDDVEATFDRSMKRFIEINKNAEDQSPKH